MNPQDFSLDFRSGIPVYVQLVEQVQAQLANGTLKPGDQLPTVRQLAAELRVNFNTIARAYRMLDEIGLISTQQGRGTYIVDKNEPYQGEGIRDEQLDTQVKNFFSLLERQGFAPSEVKVSLENNMKAWTAGSPEHAKVDSKNERTRK